MKALFFNPFSKYSDRTLIFSGILFSLIGGILGYLFNARYDGVLDLHFVEKVKLYEPFLDIFINTFASTLFLFIVGKYINKKTRFIDILNLSLIAKLPIYLLTLTNIGNCIYTISSRIIQFVDPAKIDQLVISDIVIMLLFAMLSILFLVWFVVILFNGFKTATNAKETKHTLLFVFGLLAAEILSKSIIYLIQ